VRARGSGLASSARYEGADVLGPVGGFGGLSDDVALGLVEFQWAACSSDARASDEPARHAVSPPDV